MRYNLIYIYKRYRHGKELAVGPSFANITGIGNSSRTISSGAYTSEKGNNTPRRIYRVERNRIHGVKKKKQEREYVDYDMLQTSLRSACNGISFFFFRFCAEFAAISFRKRSILTKSEELDLLGLVLGQNRTIINS